MNKNSDKIYVTVHGQRDGIGSQIQSKISGLAWCAQTNFTYVHTPLGYVGHINPKQSNELEIFFNIPGRYGKNYLQDGFSTCLKNDLENFETIVIDPKENDRILEKFQDTKSSVPLFQTLFFHNQIENSNSNPSSFYTKAFKEVIMNRYLSTPKPDLDRDPNLHHVAVHIRRGDVSKKVHPNRWVENYTYKRIIDKIREESFFIRKKVAHFHIYSEGHISDFKDIADKSTLDVTFHINENLQNTLHGMITADELIMGKSSFGYIAGLYSKGIVHYFPFWHKPLNEWIIEDDFI